MDEICAKRIYMCVVTSYICVVTSYGKVLAYTDVGMSKAKGFKVVVNTLGPHCQDWYMQLQNMYTEKSTNFTNMPVDIHVVFKNQKS